MHRKNDNIMKRKIGIICLSVVAICVLALVVKYQIEKSKLVFYDGQPLQAVDSFDYRTLYLDADGNVYISGKTGGIGIQDSWARFVYDRAHAPVRIFDQSAREAVAADAGGLIVDENGNLFYFGISEPRKVAENCLHPVGLYYDTVAGGEIVFINTDQQLCRLQKDSEIPVVWMDSILAAECGSCDLKGVLTTDGKLYCWSIGTKEYDLSNAILVAEDVDSFFTTEDMDISFAYTFVYTDKMGNAWEWKKGGTPVLLAENAEKAAYSSLDKTAIVLQKDGTLNAIQDNKTILLAQNITDFSVTPTFVCALQDSQTLLFWKYNKYDAFANNGSAKSVLSYEDAPYRWSEH